MQGRQAISDEAAMSAEDALSIELPAQDRGCPSSLCYDVARRSLGEGGKPLLQVDSSEQEAAGTRRDFLGRSAKKLAYISPVVLLLRPRPACASRIYS